LHNKASISFDNSLFESVWIAGLGKGINNFYTVYRDSIVDTTARTSLDNVCASADVFEGIYEARYIKIADSVANNKKKYVAYYGYFFDLRKGVQKLINAANDKSIPVAVISNAQQATLEATLKASGVRGVGLVIGKDTVESAGYAAKPAGGSYLYGCDLLGVKPENTLGAEDSNTGYASLVDAGVLTTIFCRNASHVTVPAVSKDGTDVDPDIILDRDDCMHDAVVNYFKATPGQSVSPSGPSAPKL